MTRVVDSSVAFKWIVAEDGQQAAEQLIGQALVAPELLLAEVCNAAWRKWRKGEIGIEQATLAPRLTRSFVELISGVDLADQALAIAIELSHPAYDCFFLALAVAIDSVVITSDERLMRVCAPTRFASRIEVL